MVFIMASAVILTTLIGIIAYFGANEEPIK